MARRSRDQLLLPHEHQSRGGVLVRVRSCAGTDRNHQGCRQRSTMPTEVKSEDVCCELRLCLALGSTLCLHSQI